MFKEGRTSLFDEARPGWPVTASKNGNIWHVEQSILEDRHVHILDIADQLNISMDTAHDIVHERLGFHKVSARWVPKQLTEEHKSNRIGLFLVHLMRYQREDWKFLSRIVMGDEMGVAYYTPEQKRLSSQWRHTNSPHPKKFKAETSMRKLMCTVFWDHEGPILIDFWSRGEIINSLMYQEILKKLWASIKRKRSGKLTKGVILHHNNATPHSAKTTDSLIEAYNWENMYHPAYSLDMAPSHSHLFAKLKEHLGGIRFLDDDELQWHAKSFLQNLGTHIYKKGVVKLPSRWDKCLNNFGDYVGK